MKRFLLFGGDTFYAEGGVKDLRAAFDTLEKAQAFTSHEDATWMEWLNILDTETGQMWTAGVRGVWSDAKPSRVTL